MNEIIRKVSNDKLIIFVCFIIALFLWISSQLSKTVHHKVELDLNFKSATNMALASDLPKSLELKAKGTGWALLFSDLRHQTPWNHQLADQKEIILSEADITKILINDFELENIELSNLIPSHLFIKQDSLVQKKVPIQSDMTISANEGFVQKVKSYFTPNEINLKGPAQMLAKINYWSVGEIELKQDLTNLKCQKTIELISGNKLLKLFPNEVKVYTEFEELTEKSFNVPIYIDTTGTQIDRIFPKEISVKIKVGLSNFNKIKASDFELGIEIDSIHKTNTHVVIVKKSPSEITSMSITPSYVDIYFKDN